MRSFAGSRTEEAVPPASSSLAPWFYRRPGLTVAVAAPLYLAVLAYSLRCGHHRGPVTMLFCLPVALLAVAFGLRVGLWPGLPGSLSSPCGC